MNEFEFGRKVKIDGEVYSIGGDYEEIKKVIKHQIKKMQEISASGGTQETQTAAIRKSAKKVLNAVLGEGAFEKIFKSRKFNVSDFTDLLLFLAREIDTRNHEQNDID